MTTKESANTTTTKTTKPPTVAQLQRQLMALESLCAAQLTKIRRLERERNRLLKQVDTLCGYVDDLMSREGVG